MKVIKTSTEALGAESAGEISKLVSRKPGCVLALSAAPQLKGLYAALAGTGADFSGCSVVLTEEFLPPDAGHSRLASLKTMLAPAGFDCSRIYSPSAVEGGCAEFDAAIDSLGGIDLAVLAIGENGRIAFNEPLAAFDSPTHESKLTESALSEECPGDASAPARGVTLGIHTLMRARRVLLAAYGSARAEAVHRAAEGRAHISVPASLMQLHLNACLYADSGAASLLG